MLYAIQYNLDTPFHGLDPNIAAEISQNSRVSIAVGDMHGNAWKMLCCLFSFGLAVADSSVQDRLRAAYNKAGQSNPNQLDRENAVIDFEQTLTFLRPDPVLIHKIKLIFIGDTLCDRGHSDYMTLLVYEWMALHKVDFVVLLSNHDVYFMHVFHRNHNEDAASYLKIREGDKSAFYSSLFMCPALYGSRASHFRPKAHTIYQRYYLPRLVAVHAHSIMDSGFRKIVYYTHAPSNLLTLIKLALLLASTVEEVFHVLLNVLQIQTTNPGRQKISVICSQFLPNFTVDVNNIRDNTFRPDDITTVMNAARSYTYNNSRDVIQAMNRCILPDLNAIILDLRAFGLSEYKYLIQSINHGFASVLEILMQSEPRLYDYYYAFLRDFAEGADIGRIYSYGDRGLSYVWILSSVRPECDIAINVFGHIGENVFDDNNPDLCPVPNQINLDDTLLGKSTRHPRADLLVYLAADSVAPNLQTSFREAMHSPQGQEWIQRSRLLHYEERERLRIEQLAKIAISDD